MPKPSIIADMVDPAMSDDLRQVEFTLSFRDGTEARLAVRPEDLAGITTTFLNYAMVAHDRQRQAGLTGQPEIRTHVTPIDVTGMAFGQTPDGKGALVLLFGATQIAVPVEADNLRSFALQALGLADALDGRVPLKQ